MEEKENKYSVKTEIENVDFVAVYQRIEAKTDKSGEELERLVLAELEKNTVERKKFNCEFFVVSVGNEYKIILTSESSNALYGGYNEFAANEIMRSLHEEIDRQGNPTIDTEKGIWELNEENHKRYEENNQ